MTVLFSWIHFKKAEKGGHWEKLKVRSCNCEVSAVVPDCYLKYIWRSSFSSPGLHKIMLCGYVHFQEGVSILFWWITNVITNATKVSSIQLSSQENLLLHFQSAGVNAMSAQREMCSTHLLEVFFKYLHQMMSGVLEFKSNDQFIQTISTFN